MIEGSWTALSESQPDGPNSNMKFERLQCEVIERELSNRKEGWEVTRKFVQGVWKRVE